MSQRQQRSGGGRQRDTLHESELVVAACRLFIVLLVLASPALVGLRRSEAFYSVAGSAALYAAVVLATLRFRLNFSGRRPLVLAVDILLLTLLIHQDGELRPEVFPFYYLVVISGAAWSGVAGAVGAAALSSLASACAVSLYVSEELRFEQLQRILLPQVLQIFLVAVLCSYLAEAWHAERSEAGAQRAIVNEFRQQINMARELQSLILPARLPRVAGLDIGVRARQADVVVGGDFYDGVAFADGAMAVCCADVSGKGVLGQLRLPLVKYAFRVCALQLREPAAVMTRLDRLLDDELPPEMFVSMVYVLLEPAAGRARVANAGHCYPLHVVARSGQVEALRELGPPLGVDPRDRGQVTEVAFEPDDFLLVYSDGVVEAKGRRERELDLDGLIRLVRETTPESAQDLTNVLFGAIEEYEIGAKRDDLTLVAVRRTALA